MTSGLPRCGLSLNAFLVCLLLAGLVPRAACAQGDGPRAYFPAPGHTHIVSGFGFHNTGNQSFEPGTVLRGADIEIDVGVVQYGWGFDLASHAAGVLLVVPGGRVDGSVDLPNQSPNSKSSGLGDIQVGMAVGLIGLPYLTRENFLQFDPGFTMAFVGRWTIATGEYDQDQPVNLGTNRDALQLLLPTAWYFGESVADPHLTTIELVPSVTFFADNDDPYGADKVEQDALLKLEAHLTRNFNQAFWASLDTFYQTGGKTTTDGVRDENNMESFNLGATAGMNLSESLGIQLSYGKTVSHHNDGLDGKMYRLKVLMLF